MDNRQQRMLAKIWNSHVLLMEMHKGSATLENSLEDSYKVKHTLTTLIGIDAKEITTQSCTQMFIVHGSFIRNNQKLEKFKWANAHWMNKSNYRSFIRWKTSHNKNEWTMDTPNNMNEYVKHYAKTKKPDTQGRILHDSIIWYSQKCKTTRAENSLVLPEHEDRGGDQLQGSTMGHGAFSGDKNIIDLDCGGGDTTVHICQNSTCTTKNGEFDCVNYTSIHPPKPISMAKWVFGGREFHSGCKILFVFLKLRVLQKVWHFLANINPKHSQINTIFVCIFYLK